VWSENFTLLDCAVISSVLTALSMYRALVQSTGTGGCIPLQEPNLSIFNAWYAR
jgi:hypothetical protein